MVDLNSEKYLKRKDDVTKENILKYISEYDIVYHYLGDVKLGQLIKSPIRKGDEHPSFNIFYSEKFRCLMFKDFAYKTGDVIVLVKELLKLESMHKTLLRIIYDFNLQDYFYISTEDRKLISGLSPSVKTRPAKVISDDDYEAHDKSGYKISIKIRPWTLEDEMFWIQYGITLPTLRRYNVFPIKGYHNGIFYIHTQDLAYAFAECKDNRLSYKIYRPLARKDRKWRTDHTYDVHQGYIQLPPTGDFLIITKSLKDVMSITELTSYPAVAIQGETMMIKPSVIEEYRRRFNNTIFTLFDNDSQGKALTSKYMNTYGTIPLMIPSDLEGIAKDFSDMVKITGERLAARTLKDMISKHLGTNLKNK